jgi:hypothetical protein
MGTIYPRAWRRTRAVTPAVVNVDIQVEPDEVLQCAGSAKSVEHTTQQQLLQSMLEIYQHMPRVRGPRANTTRDDKIVVLLGGHMEAMRSHNDQITTPTMVGVGTVGVCPLTETGRASGDLGARRKKTTDW